MKQILVTGAGGFLAGHTIEELHDRGYKVIGLTRHMSTANAVGNHTPDTLYFGDMKDREVVEKAVNMADGVINLAGILGTQETITNPFPSVEVNIFGALYVLEACKTWNKPLIQIAVGNHFMDNSYSITKTTAERFVKMYAREHGVRANVVRALNAYGPRQKDRPIRKIVASFVTRALAGEPIQIYGDGQQEMDMVYVRDIAHILVDKLEALDKPYCPVGQVYEAGTGIAPTVNEIARTIIRLSQSKSKIEYLPMRPGEPAHSTVIARDPVKHDYTSLEDGLAQTIDWYRERA